MDEEWQAKRCEEIKARGFFIISSALVGTVFGTIVGTVAPLFLVFLVIPIWMIVNEVGDLVDDASWEQHEHEVMAGETDG